MVWPTAMSATGFPPDDADFTNDNDGFGSDGTVTFDGGESTGVVLPGGVP